MAVAREEELYKPIKKYYEQLGYAVKSEVLHCDLVAIHPERADTIIVEMKKHSISPCFCKGLNVFD